MVLIHLGAKQVKHSMQLNAWQKCFPTNTRILNRKQ